MHLFLGSNFELEMLVMSAQAL